MKKIVFSLIICFCLVSILRAQTPAELKSYLPKVSGWSISDDIEVFNRENLYERINGAAPLYLENNFQEMTSLVYAKGDNYITIQAYRHATPIDAFGMYSSERSSEMTFYKIGGEAQADNIGLYGFAGCIYLKMQASDESDEIGEALRAIATGLTAKIDPNATYPGLFKHFPVENKSEHSEAYITSNYIGHEFLKGVYTSNYKKGDKQVQLFAIEAKSFDELMTVGEKYFTFTKQTEYPEEGEIFIIKDKYNGDIPCIWKGLHVVGIFDEEGNGLGEFSDGTLIKQFIKNLAK